MEVKAALYLAAGCLFLLLGVLLSGRVGIAGLGLVVLPMITLGLCLITIGVMPWKKQTRRKEES
jgi:hypothetical protein